jgi:uncharacterized protein (DUF4415 family)
MTEKLVRFEMDLNNPPPLTEAQREELERLSQMKDEDIDFSDIPRLTEKFWANAIPFRDRHLYRPVKQQVTLRIDADILDWFKRRAKGGRGYQTAINAALRKVVEGGGGKVLMVPPDSNVSSGGPRCR